jgi:hypothetical protein
MQLHRHLVQKLLGKAGLATLAMGGFLLLVGAPSAKAQGWDDCNRRVANANYQLHEAIEHYGYFSRAAKYWRHEQHEAYEQLERFQRQEARERARREHEWREHERREWREHHRDRDDYRYRDGDRDRRERDRP